MVAQFPCAAQKSRVTMAQDAKLYQALKSQLCAELCEFPPSHVTPQSMRNLDVQQMGCVETVYTGEDPSFNAQALIRPEQPLDHRGSIYDDHLLSRASRMTCAAGVDKTTGS